MSSVRTRFAPSPTGYMHIGGMRTALFNWLWARHNGGQFVLRIDDTDQDRNIEAALQPILDAFRWLGIDWDEGPEVGGPYEPYFQSQRGDLYSAAAEQLLAAGKAFRDFDPPELEAADREAAQKEKRDFLNVRRSLELSASEIEDRVAQGQPHVIRLLVDRTATVALDDGVRGHVEWECARMADPKLVRSNGRPLYNFATVVDDRQLEISHVLRGEEHLTNTAVQLLIYQALEATAPQFFHIPFITAPGTSKKLSKRDLARYRNNPQFRKMFMRADELFPRLGYGDSERLNPVMVEYYERIGYLPEAIFNALSRLGWSYDDKTENMSRDFVVSNFDLGRIVKSPAGLDTDKLDSYQLHWMNQLTLEQKIEGALPYLQQVGLLPEQLAPEQRDYLGQVITALGERLKVFSDILDVEYFFSDSIDFDAKAFKKRIRKEGVPQLLGEFRSELAACSPWTAEAIEQRLQAFVERHEISAGLMIHALRISTTGQPNGPGVYECVELVGQQRSLDRIDQALAQATTADEGQGS